MWPRVAALLLAAADARVCCPCCGAWESEAAMRYVRLSDTDVAWAPRGGDTCAFPPVTAARLCAAVGANGTLSIIGDSLAVSQLHALARSATDVPLGPRDDGFDVPCGNSALRVRMVRANMLQADAGWVSAACGSDVVFLNSGAHWGRHEARVRNYRPSLERAFADLDAACGGDFRDGRRRKLLFRSTPEGNPFCHAGLDFATTAAWEATVGCVLDGRCDPGNFTKTPVVFDVAWGWRHFSRLDADARGAVESSGLGSFHDVTPLTRLRPRRGAPDRQRPGDCLHDDPATGDWNAMLVNALLDPCA